MSRHLDRYVMHNMGESKNTVKIRVKTNGKNERLKINGKTVKKR